MPSFSMPLRECRVLLADDDALVRAVYADTLRAHGCEVTEAGDGGQAVALAPTLMPDMVLMDLSMPGVDGWQALAELRADPRTRALVVVALTASDSRGVRERAAAAGFDGFVLKPFTAAALLRALEAAWEQVRASPRPPPPAEHNRPHLGAPVIAR
jgi:CheY-like chemotaxis protein